MMNYHGGNKMGGSGASLGRRSRSGADSSSASTNVGPIKFTSNEPGVYESNYQQVVAAGIRRSTGEAVGAREPMFTVIEENGSYKLYQTLFGGRKVYIKKTSSLQAAVKAATKRYKDLNE